MDIRIDTNMGLMKSMINKPTTPTSLDPNTFLIPISLVLCVIVYEANPKRPRQATIIAKNEKRVKTFPNC